MKKWLLCVLAVALSFAIVAGTWISFQWVEGFPSTLTPHSQLIAKDVITPDQPGNS